MNGRATKHAASAWRNNKTYSLALGLLLAISGGCGSNGDTQNTTQSTEAANGNAASSPATPNTSAAALTPAAAPSTAPAPTAKAFAVTYKVSGIAYQSPNLGATADNPSGTVAAPGACEVSYSDASGKSVNAGMVTLPWSTSFSVPAGAHLSLLAANDNQMANSQAGQQGVSTMGHLAIEIQVDGHTIRQQASTVDFGTVDAAYDIPVECPAGARAVCSDGWVSYADNAAGSCSSHGGVKQFCK